VGFDDFNGTLQSTRYLIGMGHSHIVFAGDLSYPWLHRRFEGYKQGMRENRLKPVSIMARNSQSFVDFGEKSVERILARRPRPTAAVAGNDEIAYGLWRSLQRHGIKVPDDISLVGFDDREEAVLMDPPLSTVRVHKEEIGETCMKMLLERLHHPRMTFSQRILPTELVIRGTVRQLNQ
jgi:LacI family transcriptional regulator